MFKFKQMSEMKYLLTKRLINLYVLVDMYFSFIPFHRGVWLYLLNLCVLRNIFIDFMLLNLSHIIV
jgi:hypothetical protein